MLIVIYHMRMTMDIMYLTQVICLLKINIDVFLNITFSFIMDIIMRAFHSIPLKIIPTHSLRTTNLRI